MLNFFNRFKNLEFSNRNGRIEALDLYRFLAIVLMIQGHTIFELSSPNALNVTQFPWDVWTFIRGLTAPVFMMISGGVNVFANKRSDDGTIQPKYLKKRLWNAALVLFTSYILVFPASSLKMLHQFDTNFWLSFFQTNILHIVAIGLIILQLFYLITRNNRSLAKISLAFGLVGLIFSWFSQIIDWYQYMPMYLAPLFSYKYGSIYTFFPTSSYFFIGVAIGAYLKDVKKEDLFNVIFHKAVKIGSIITASGIIIHQLLSGFQPIEIPAFINPGFIVIRIGIVMLLFPFVVLLKEKVKRFSKIYLTLSKKSLFLYVTHLLIIYGCSCFPGLADMWAGKLFLPELFFAILLVEALSLSIAYYYDQTVKLIPYIRYAYASVIFIIILMLNVLY
jgi:uncharacterized membrane protein